MEVIYKVCFNIYLKHMWGKRIQAVQDEMKKKKVRKILYSNNACFVIISINTGSLCFSIIVTCIVWVFQELQELIVKK